MDEELRELILEGVNAGKYKRLSRDKKFVKKLVDIYNLMCSVEACLAELNRIRIGNYIN